MLPPSLFYVEELAVRGEEHQILARLGLSILDMVGKRCLEIGSGDCLLGHVCQGYGINLISLDKAPGGRPGSHSYHESVLFVKADAKKLPFPSSCFDLVISHWAPPTVCFSTTTIYEIKSSCREILRVLEEGGEFRCCPDFLAGKYWQPIRVTPGEKERLREKMDKGSKIAVWKKSREIFQSMLPGITFSQSLMIDDYDYGISFCIVRKPGGSPAGKNATQTEFAVILTGFDAAKRINVMKVVRGITSLSLKEAKEFVERVPMLVKERISKDDSEKLKKQLEDGGARIEVK